MSECKHIQSEFTWRGEVAFARHCMDCKERLSLGPSNDEPAEVKVEIRAAEIATPLVFLHEQKRTFRIGWFSHGLDEDLPMGSTTINHLAGWLAREMHTFDR